MTWSETALKELTCVVLGDLLEKGIVDKLVDDLYYREDTQKQLLVTAALNRCGLKLSSSKPVIAPRKTTVLGWI